MSTGRALWISLVLTAALGLVQIGGGLAFDSLALITDAVHNLSDGIAVLLAVAPVGKLVGTIQLIFTVSHSYLSSLYTIIEFCAFNATPRVDCIKISIKSLKDFIKA